MGTAQSKECKKKFEAETNVVKQLGDQLKTVKKTAGDAKGKEEKARLDGEAEALGKQVDEAQKDLDTPPRNAPISTLILLRLLKNQLERSRSSPKLLKMPRKPVTPPKRKPRPPLLPFQEVTKIRKKKRKKRKKKRLPLPLPQSLLL